MLFCIPHKVRVVVIVTKVLEVSMTASVQPVRGVSLGMTTPLCKQRTEEPITIKHSFTLVGALCFDTAQ